MQYAIEYQKAAKLAYERVQAARAVIELHTHTGLVYSRMLAESDYRYWSKRAYQFSKLSMMYREQRF